MKKKVGFWLPFRKEMASVSYESPGALVEEVREKFVSHLSSGNIELVEILDFRKGIVCSGIPKAEGKDLSSLDAFIWFGEIGKDHRREHNLEILKAIEKNATVINSTRGYELAMDKYLTSSTLSKNGIRVPDFALLTRENAEEVSKEAAGWGPALLKPRLGSYGIGIIKIENPADLPDYADYFPGAVHYVEKFIPNDPANWIGVNIIGGKHAYSYKKGPESFYGGWKVRDRTSTGGKMLLATPSEEQLEVAKKIANLFDMEWVGIDMITGKDGKIYVIDVNAFPGLYPEMFMQAGIDGPKMMAEAALSRIGV